MRLVSPAHSAKIVVKRASSGTDVIRPANATRRTPSTAIRPPDIATASQNGEVCRIFSLAFEIVTLLSFSFVILYLEKKKLTVYRDATVLCLVVDFLCYKFLENSSPTVIVEGERDYFALILI